MTTVDARVRYNPTGLIVPDGARIRVHASRQWTDLFKTVDADGYDPSLLRPFIGLRRLRSARWFQLCGAIGESEDHLFALGARIDEPVAAPAAGPLFLFANDAWGMYWNNRGSIDVTVEIVG